MLNHRLIHAPKETGKFVDTAIEFLKKHCKEKKIFCALSGGIDSTATFLLLKKAKINALPVFIDHGLMRIIRGKEEKDHIKKLFPEVVIIDIREKFLPKIIAKEDAEEKRKLFKIAYSEVISEFIKKENCQILADGTILPDIEESFGIHISDLKETMDLEEERELMKKNIGRFVKSQHNVDIKYEVEATVQPVASLTKPEIRKVLEYFKMPQELIYRKAFPGPALAARIIGPVNLNILEFEKHVHDIVESIVDDYYINNYGKQMIINKEGEQEPFQVFAATGQNILNKKVTGILNGKRSYNVPLSVKGEWNYLYLTKLASELKGYARLLYEVYEQPDGLYDVLIRSVNSKDARTASVTNLSLNLINDITKKLIDFPETKTVYYDITPKPPATIEYV